MNAFMLTADVESVPNIYFRLGHACASMDGSYVVHWNVLQPHLLEPGLSWGNAITMEYLRTRKFGTVGI